MMLGGHIVASGVTTVAFYSLVPSWEGALACFFSGFLIDVDHAFDYYLRKKKFCWSLKDLVHFCEFENGGEMYLFLHSYELAIFLWVTTYFVTNPMWLGLVFGMSIHLVLDQIFNNVYPWAYFFIYRARYGFPHKIFFNDLFVKTFKQKR